MPSPRWIAVALAASLALAAPAAASGGGQRSTLSPAQQRAAKAATSAYRSEMTRAGQRLAAAIVAGDLAGARQAFDYVRPQLGDPGASATGSLAAALWPSQGRSADLSALAARSPALVVVLGRIVLSPQAIAQSAQRDAIFVSRNAPGVLTGRSAVDLGDLRATARAASEALAGDAAIARSVDRSSALRSEQAAARLEAALGSAAPSPRAVVAAADLLAAALGREAWRLTGYGKGSLYQ